jgi:hypothetical protein
MTEEEATSRALRSVIVLSGSHRPMEGFERRAEAAARSSGRLDLDVLGCARCEDRAEATALVSTRAGSFRIDLCGPHMEEVLAGARPIG